MSDDLTTARDFLLHADTNDKPGLMLAAATAHAAVDAAETLRRIEGLLRPKPVMMVADQYRPDSSDAPAPAPLTEREVTAEVEDVEPASDKDIERDSVAVLALQRHHRERYYRLIARVRAEQARADEAVGRAEREEANARQAWKREAQFRKEADRAREAEAKAEAQVALMHPVVDAAQEYEETHPATEGHLSACRLVCPAVRAYRAGEATRDA